VASSHRIARLVGNASGLCVTSGAANAPPANDQDELIRDPIIHEFIRHGYISALQHWDDVASAVRQSQEYTGRKIPAIWVRTEQNAVFSISPSPRITETAPGPQQEHL
jgi:hypothetical protein